MTGVQTCALPIWAFDRPLTVDFVAASSYGAGTTSSGTVRWTKAPSVPVRGRHVLLVEDIVDTGRTLDFVRQRIEADAPARVRIVTLLDKPSRRERPVHLDHVGFTVADQFVVGYGLDAAGQFRHLRHIAVLPEGEAAHLDRGGVTAEADRQR